MPEDQLFHVRFLADDVQPPIEIMVERGTNLLEAAVRAGIHVNASCGGKGVCGTCKIKVEKGRLENAPSEKISREEYERGIRLACQSRVDSDLVISIPLESRSGQAVQARERARPLGASISRWTFDPPLKKYYLELQPPTPTDNSSDLFRLLSGLEHTYNLKNVPAGIEVLRKLALVLREGNWKATVTTLVDASRPRAKETNSLLMTNIEAGDTRATHLGLAIDIGTTTVCSQLLDLNQAKILAESIIFNKQRTYGDDVITRIVHSQKPEGLADLQKAVVASINESIELLLAESKMQRRDIGHVIIAGNTTMEMLLLGLDPKYIRLSPYVTTANYLPLVKAASLGINLPEHVYLFSFPNVSSYVGGDIVSGLLAAGVHQTDKLTFYMDIGTNGEIVIGNSDWMVTASCSAGPAFEGAGIKHGMVALKGAIQDFSIDAGTLEPTIQTIGGVPPRGICGSGLINIIADLLVAGVIDQNGKYNNALSSPRLRPGADGFEYVLAWAPQTQIGQDIVLTEVDINNLIRAKAAMYAGCHTLTRQVNVSCNDFEQVILAGNFGSSLNMEKAIIIGLLPDIPREKFSFIGNACLSGARLVSFSTGLLDDSRRVAQMMTNVELSENNDFTNNYIAALFLPHTDGSAFPSVADKLP